MLFASDDPSQNANDNSENVSHRGRDRHIPDRGSSKKEAYTACDETGHFKRKCPHRLIKAESQQSEYETCEY